MKRTNRFTSRVSREVPLSRSADYGMRSLNRLSDAMLLAVGVQAGELSSRTPAGDIAGASLSYPCNHLLAVREGIVLCPQHVGQVGIELGGSLQEACQIGVVE